METNQKQPRRTLTQKETVDLSDWLRANKESNQGRAPFAITEKAKEGTGIGGLNSNHVTKLMAALALPYRHREVGNGATQKPLPFSANGDDVHKTFAEATWVLLGYGEASDDLGERLSRIAGK